MAGMLSPSVMCADLLHLYDEITKLDSLGVEFLHIDFMDNKFVPNITFDTNMVRSFKKAMKNIRRDIHIMAFEPQKYFDNMEISAGDMVSVHYEACEDVHSVLAEIRSRGASPCLAISPDTPVGVVKDFMSEVEAFLLMTVYPGFAGQPLAPKSMERLAELKSIVSASGKDIKIEVDGNVSWDHCVEMRENGADIFVAGSSSVYGQKYPLEEAVKVFYSLVK
ncbi:MAG: ribulose-phosphate 3-epimerase [Ruminococcus sp.]|nr:ribulose-phosphate 3-epimerase [Ruminococcus sp.]